MKRQFQWPWRDTADIRSEVDEEIRFHLDMRMEKLMADGLDPREARDKALQEFGDMDEARRSLRKADLRNETRRRRSEWILEILQDLKYALRTLAASREFAVMAVLTLALGIAATTVVFSFMDGVIVRPLPFADAEQLIRLDGQQSPPDFVDMRDALRQTAALAAYHYDSVVLTTESSSEEVRAARVTPGFFETLAVRPELGRLISEQDAIPDQDNFIVLSDEVWRSRFAADRDLIGKTIRIDGEPYTLIGVMPAAFAFPASAKAWIPRSFSTPDLTTQRGAHYLDVIGRLQPGSTRQTAQTRLTALLTQLQQEYPKTNANGSVAIKDLKESIVGDYRQSLFVLMAAGFCLLLIACANIAGLTLVRTLDRGHELALRSALGAGRWRIARTLLAESVIIAALGGTMGIILSLWGIDALVALEAGRIPRLSNVHLDARTMTFAIAVTCLSTLAFGLLPSFRVLRAANLSGSLAEAGRSLVGFRFRGRMQGILVAAEIALTLVLIAGAGLLLRTFLNLQQVDPGFAAADVLTFDLSLPRSRYPETRQSRTFFKDFEDRVRHTSGVTAAGGVSGMPFTDYNYHISVAKLDGGTAGEGPGTEKSVQLRIASPDYFRAMGFRLVRGRFLEEGDHEGAPLAVVITESAARLLWPNHDAIGRTVELGTGMGLGVGRVGGMVVGIIGDYYDFGVRQPRPPILFAAHAQFPVSSQTMTIRTAGNPKAVIEIVRNELRKMDSELPMANVQEFSEVAKSALAEDRSYAVLVGLFAAMALMLAASGIYGITAYSVSQRKREFGVRLALGATPAGILGSVLQRSVRLALAGIAIGLACTWALTRSLEKMLFALSPTDPVTLFAAAGGFLMVALLASWFPARHAKRVDPMAALRNE